MGIGNDHKLAHANVLLGRSLPLMGIGNGVFNPGRVGGVGDLITPHGDRKPYQGQIGWHELRAVSLPLMGIGNTERPV